MAVKRSSRISVDEAGASPAPAARSGSAAPAMVEQGGSAAPAMVGRVGSGSSATGARSGSTSRDTVERSGSASPATAARSGSASSRPRLDPGVIVATGLELAATRAATISVRDLGARLGADPTAIYRHFRSKDDLMRALLDEVTLRAVDSVEVPLENWRGRLRALAEATLDLYSEYPAVGAEATTLTTHGPGELGAIELMLQAFTTAGLNGPDVVRHYALMASHVLSTAAGIARAKAVPGDEDDDEDGPWFDEPPLADPRRYPRIAEHMIALASLRDRELFFLGVELILDSAERAAR